MRGIRLIPHNTLKNDKIKDVLKGIHRPKRYSERYNFKCLDVLTREGEPLPLNKLMRKDILSKLWEGKTESDIMFLQDNFIYEIEITSDKVEFRLLSDEIEEHKKVYEKFIDKVKFLPEVKDYPVEFTKDLTVVEMVTESHFMFSLDTAYSGLEPLKYILDLKRLLKPGEKFIYQVILHSKDNDWWEGYGEAYRKFKRGSIPRKFTLSPQMIAKFGGEVALRVAIEGVAIMEELIYGDSVVANIDLTEDSVAEIRRDRGLSKDTLEKGKEIGFEVAIRGLCYAKSNARREFICKQFNNCFSCLEGDNKLVMNYVKMNKNMRNRVKYREISNIPILSSQMILSASEVSKLIYLPQITLQREYDIERLDFTEVRMVDELLSGDIPIGQIIGGGKYTYWSKIKDVRTLSKVIVGVKGSGKSTYLENYVYHAYKSGECIIYFDYIENNVNAHEVSKYIPQEDKVILDLSKGFTFNYPELDISNIPRDEDYERTLKRFASDYCRLIEKFINTINTDDTSDLTGNMRNILVSACSFTFLSGNVDMYSIYKILTDHRFRAEVVAKVKAMNVYREDDFRYDILKSLDEYEEVGKGKARKTRVVGTNNRADRVLDRFNALMRDSRTEEMLLGINRNNINFVEVFEQNKAILILMPEDYFSDYELKDIVVTYFLSRMWLSGLKRAKLIPERDKRNVVHIILDEIHQLKHSTSLMLKNIAEDRKFRTTYIFTCQYLKQFGNLWSAVKGSGSHFMLLSGTEKENFRMLSEEIGENFTLDELIQLPPRSSLNLIRYNGQNIISYISNLPPMLSTELRGMNLKPKPISSKKPFKPLAPDITRIPRKKF